MYRMKRRPRGMVKNMFITTSLNTINGNNKDHNWNSKNRRLTKKVEPQQSTMSPTGRKLMAIKGMQLFYVFKYKLLSDQFTFN